MFTKDFDPAGIPHTPVVAAGAEARRAGAEAQSKENPGVLYINVEVGCIGIMAGPLRAGLQCTQAGVVWVLIGLAGLSCSGPLCSLSLVLPSESVRVQMVSSGA